MWKKMKCKSIACLIILLNIAGVIVLASSDYDSIECDPNSNRARKGRARLIQSIPCDLSKQNYCNLPGDSYPWNAVKRFVYDNQGLIRRMYGDLRHIFVMQSELENEIDFDDIKLTADKYSRAFNTHNNPRPRQMKANKKATKSSTTTKTTAKSTERKNYRSGDEPHFRPAQRPSAINTKQRTKPPRVSSNENEKASLIDNLIQTNVESLTNTKSNEKPTSTITTTKLTSISPSSTTPSISTSEIMSDESNNSIAESHQKTHDDESDRERNETVDTVVYDLFSNISSALSASSTSTESAELKTSTTSSTTTTQASTVSENTSQKPSIMTKATVPVDENEKKEEEELDEILSELENDSVSSESSSSVVFEKIDDKGEVSKDPSSVTTTTEAQLYQDAIPTANRRGVNACPVKEEVVAPFWGNNTRGEILALLNVYPFEQYINWEKCTNENEQMYCRKGCRCEQQYRLHRLLAYNPLDACRGIFSDWFRFPSCCICKCYDIPLDYRVTSRSPRGSDKVLDAISDNEDIEDDDADVEDSFENDKEENYYFDEDD